MANAKLTESQQLALEVSGRDVLVSAAAGSGKTFTLTQRIIKNILEKNADISRILVVTFTRAAASELKSRISSALMDKISENPDNQHLTNQLLMLGSADICTIDSFLLRPVRENFEKLNLPPSMRIAEDSEISVLKKNVMTQVMDSIYDEYGVCSDSKLSDISLSTPLTDLLLLLSSTVKDSSDTIPYLINLHNKLITSPRGTELLNDFSQRLRGDANKDFLLTAEGLVVCDELKKIIDGALNFYHTYIPQISDEDSPAVAYLPTFIDDETDLNSIFGGFEKGYKSLGEQLFSFGKSRLKIIRSENKTPLTEYLQATRKEIVTQISNFAEKYFSFDCETISQTYNKTAELTDVLYTLLSKYDKQLSKEKINLGIYEFSDMPRYMLKLLQNNDGTPTETAKNIAKNYDEIYVDEYQDVNEIQDRIFQLISSDNRFMVGDLKQSIYAFRDAEPTFFTKYRNLYPEYRKYEEDDSVTVGSTIFMSNNFRSDENVIKFSNLVCSPIFRACGTDISYTDNDDLVFSKKQVEGYIPPEIEVHLVGKGAVTSDNNIVLNTEIVQPSLNPNPSSDKKLTEESVIIANKIAELLRFGKKSNGSPIKPSDIAVLVRKKNSIPIITHALKCLNIQYLVASKSELLQSREMNLLVDLCEIIDNPRNDVPLCNILTCETLAEELHFTVGDLIAIKKYAPKDASLYDALCIFADESEKVNTLSKKCKIIVQKLSRLRALSIKFSANKFLRLLSIDDVFSPVASGDAFKFMYDSACKYTKSFWNGLSGFIKYFKDFKENGNVSGEVQKIDDAVNIITVHYSKGLQYNTCFLFDFADEFSKKDMQKSIVYDKNLCLGMEIPYKDPDGINTIKKPSIIHRTVCLDMQNKLHMEEMRILYVAMTRAEERLYISGTISGNTLLSNYLKKFNLYGVSNHAVTSCSTLMAWILGGMKIDGGKSDCYKLFIHQSTNQTPLCTPFGVSEDSQKAARIGEKEIHYANLISSPPSQKREELLLATIPSKVAASKASPTMLDSGIFSYSLENLSITSNGEDNLTSDFERLETEQTVKDKIEILRSSPPEFENLLTSNKKATATDRGTATHLFLQYCDYQNVLENGVENEISRLSELKFISKQSADMLNKNTLSRCLSSEFFKTVMNSNHIRREFQFKIFRPASDFTQDEELSKLFCNRRIFVQGSIDLLFEDSDGSLCICDYKTDRITPEEKQNHELLKKRLCDTYKEQLSQYVYAVEQIFTKKPDKIFILSIPLGEAFQVEI